MDLGIIKTKGVFTDEELDDFECEECNNKRCFNIRTKWLENPSELYIKIECPECGWKTFLID